MKTNYFCALVFATTMMVNLESNAQSTATTINTTEETVTTTDSFPSSDVNYSNDASVYTNRMNKELGLSREQQARISAINEQRAERMNRAYATYHSDSSLFRKESSAVDTWADNEYKGVLDSIQYSSFLSKKGSFEEFKYKSPTMKVKATESKVKVEDKTTGATEKIKTDDKKMKVKKKK